jgi:dUTP pyrophosphatase
MSSPVMYVEITSTRAEMPTAGSSGAAGLDLYSAQTACINPGQRQLISTGVKVAIPVGHYGRVAPRSGLALKHGIDTMAGVIDSDYRGEVGVLLINLGDAPFNIYYGDRIAQLVIEKISHPRLVLDRQLGRHPARRRRLRKHREVIIPRRNNL